MIYNIYYISYIKYRDGLGISTGGEGEKLLVRLLGDELIKLCRDPIHSCQQRWKIYCSKFNFFFSCNQSMLFRCSDWIPLCSSKYSTKMDNEQNLLFWQTLMITLKNIQKWNHFVLGNIFISNLKSFFFSILTLFQPRSLSLWHEIKILSSNRAIKYLTVRLIRDGKLQIGDQPPNSAQNMLPGHSYWVKVLLILPQGLLRKHCKNMLPQNPGLNMLPFYVG